MRRLDHHHKPTMRRWLSTLASVAVVAMLSSAGAAEAPSRLFKIGVVTEAGAANHPIVEGLKAGLRELGLEEGREVAFDIRFTQGKADALPTAARALIDSRVDALFTVGPAATIAARALTTDIPIVFTLIGDPVATGIVKDTARPGGNLTGISNLAQELGAKRLEILKTLYPGLKRVWVIYARDDAATGIAIDNVRLAATRLGVRLVARIVAESGQVGRVTAEFQRGDGLLVPDDDALELPSTLLAASLTGRMPAVFPSALWVGYGGLVSYGTDFFAQGVQAARIVAKISRGAAPGILSVEGLDSIEMAVNLRTASDLGIKVPPKVLLRADTIRR